MYKRKCVVWRKLYDAIWKYDEVSFTSALGQLLLNCRSRYEREDAMFKAGDTYLEIFSDKDRALEYYDQYIGEFGPDGRFYEQVLKRKELLG